MAPRNNRTGIRYGKLVAIEPAHQTHSTYFWKCRCDCGNIVIIDGGSLTSGNTTSCGCYKKEVTRKRSVTHNKSKSPEYIIWRSMISRCECKGSSSYSKYGAKGISVCGKWMESFVNFLNDMGSRPSRNHTIDRYPNNKGNYSPSNCRWATQKQQQNNRTNNRMITANGITMNLTQWAEYIEINKKTLTSRLSRGWSDDRIINTPVKGAKK